MLSVTAQLVSLCLMVQYVNASLLIPRAVENDRTQDGSELSALHDVVGRDGVLMIHLERGNRRNATNPRLHEVGIYPTISPALDVQLASPDTLRQGCLLHDKPGTSLSCGVPHIRGGKVGSGCFLTVEQAIADSHRQALLTAQTRNSTWTAILEDDAVPVDPTAFNSNFKQAWAQIPPETGFVRLGWCEFKYREQSINFTFGSFLLVSGYQTGGCTHAYMVRHDFVPTMLGLFPCCSALDACFQYDLFKWPPRCGTENKGECWGHKYMMGIDTVDSEKLTEGWAPFRQRGILVQDNRKSVSIKNQLKVDHGDSKHS